MLAFFKVAYYNRIKIQKQSKEIIMTIDDLRRLCKDETIQISEHCYKRSVERKITYDEIKQCILSGEIIEDYPDDYPFPSALVLNQKTGKPLHVVAGLSEEYLWIIRVYRPESDKWESDHKTRKELK